jgi:SAM-dependent methyltransferase
MDLQEAARLYAEYKQRGVEQEVAPDDQMWASGAPWYWSVGESGLLCVLHALTLSWTSRVARVLDLPCGHGRVARHLRAAFPQAELFACDLDRRGVDFCASRMRMRPIYSTPELVDAPIPGDLDVIWVGSLFTHVDEQRTTRWLSFLAERLAPHGVLVATFHGPAARILQKSHRMIDEASWARIEAMCEERGFGYAPYVELDLGDYGISLARPSKILELASALRGTRIAYYQERGWANNHDVLAIARTDREAPF